MEAVGALASRFQHAVNAATAANNPDFVRQLLKGRLFREDQTDDDGWTAAYTAFRYDHDEIAALIERVDNNIKRPKQEPANRIQTFKLPTEWHPTDISGYLSRLPDNMSITVTRGADLPGADSRAIARADHPMVPNKDGIYYFEVTLVKKGAGKCVCGVGFCDEAADFDNMLGWQEGAWGYHSDDGNLFWSGQRYAFNGDPYGPGFGEGSVVGCGVNFKEGTAFYTVNGEIMGRAFTDLRGRLYPAVSMSTRMVGWTVTVRFWDDDESAVNSFKFQGPYDDPLTLEPSERYRIDDEADPSEDDDVSVASTSSAAFSDE